MQGITGDELSPKKAEYLKFIYTRGDTVKTTDVATQFSVAPSTVTKALSEIAEAGFLEHSPYRGVRLTSRGTVYARFLFRRHRIVALALSRYGLEPGEACREATKIEAHISKDLVNRICSSLGHPIMSVCGEIEHDQSCCCPPGNLEE